MPWRGGRSTARLGDNTSCTYLLSFLAKHSIPMLPPTQTTTLSEACEAINTSSLVVALMRTGKKETAASSQGERALTYYPNALMPEFFPDPQRSRMVYTERDNIRALRPDLEASVGGQRAEQEPEHKLPDGRRIGTKQAGNRSGATPPHRSMRRNRLTASRSTRC